MKEKEQAHREYRQAISEGHGAYLMDEETPVSQIIVFIIIMRALCKVHDDNIVGMFVIINIIMFEY